jgi:hypothetical protein
MNNLLKADALSARFQLSRHVALAITALALCGVGLRGQTQPVSITDDKPGLPMKQFVFIFRQSPRQLTDADKQRRAEETVAWARRQNGAGHKLDPHILAPESAHRGPEISAVTSTEAWPVTALLFLEAHDLPEAAQVAESHPALGYGANIEVRPWAPPAPTTASRP